MPMKDLELYDVLASSDCGATLVSPERGAVVIRFMTLADTYGVGMLAKAALTAAAKYHPTLFVSDASGVEGASFDAMWQMEEALIAAPRCAGSLREWRHVPSGSIVLQTALRRLLRQAQAAGLSCGIYPDLQQALSGSGGWLMGDDNEFLSSPTGFVARAGDHVLAELRNTVSDIMLYFHIDAVTLALQGYRAQRVILRLVPGLHVSVTSLVAQISRVLNLGACPCVVVADEAGLFRDNPLPDMHNGVLHVARNMNEAKDCLAAISLDRFRLGASAPVAPRRLA
jgi:hypothetical protein